MLRGSEGSLNHRHLEVGVRDLGWEKGRKEGRTSHVLPAVRCSQPVGCELGSSDLLCASKDRAESDGEKRRGWRERRGIQPQGSQLESGLRDAVRDSFFLEKLLEEHPWWDPAEIGKPSAQKCLKTRLQRLCRVVGESLAPVGRIPVLLLARSPQVRGIIPVCPHLLQPQAADLSLLFQVFLSPLSPSCSHTLTPCVCHPAWGPARPKRVPGWPGGAEGLVVSSSHV